jgi:hypothetical protein
MGKWKCWQNEEKTEDQHEEKMKDAPSKWKDDRKEGESASKSKERQEVRKKRARITKEKKLQIAASDQKKPPRGRGAVVEYYTKCRREMLQGRKRSRQVVGVGNKKAVTRRQ